MTRLVSTLMHEVNLDFRKKYNSSKLHRRRFILLLLVSITVHAEEGTTLFDQKVSLVGRSYPVGAQALYTAGINKQIWSDSEAAPWKYGYIRAAVNAATSAVINRIGAELQFYPISIFGLSAGYDWGFRSFKPQFVDCNTYDCVGRVDRAFVKAQMLAAYSKFIFVGNVRYENLTHKGGPALFFDEMTLLPGKSSGEEVLILNPTLLYTVTDRYKLGMTSLLARGVSSETLSHLWGPVVQYKANEQMNATVGFGQNHSSLVHTGFALFFLMNFTIDPSLSIVDRPLRKN